MAKTVVNRYTFSYRLLKEGDCVREERDYLWSEDNVKVQREQVVKPTAFFSRRAVFAPLTILARERQDKYQFRFIRHDRHAGRRAAVIGAIPGDRGREQTIYGLIWIDSEDFSVLKIEADPRSIRGYQRLKELEKQLQTRLFLSLSIEFDEIHKGIRFPTRVQMLEKYNGGRLISRYTHSAGWERNRTVFTYDKYQFFNVNVDVTY